MSKKSKKLKKLLRQQAIERARQQHQNIHTPEPAQAPQYIKQASPPPSAPAMATAPATAAAAAPAPSIITADLHEKKEVIAEAKKILLTMLVLLTVIIAVYFINIKTNFIIELGTWLFGVLNIKV